MGSSTSVYIGPYISAKIERKSIPNNYKVNSEGKPFKLNDNFDSETGEKLKLFESTKRVTITPRVWSDDAPEDLREDTFFSPEWVNQNDEQCLFLLNGNETSRTLDPEDLFELDLNISLFQDVETLLIQFRREYNKYIEYYKSKYSIEIKYGIISYTH